jgi:hypothetical protein
VWTVQQESFNTSSQASSRFYRHTLMSPPFTVCFFFQLPFTVCFFFQLPFTIPVKKMAANKWWPDPTHD